MGIVQFVNKEVSDGYMWRTRTGEMQTSHMFNVVSMIWNHVMPADAATHNYQRYAFTSAYTKDYMTLSIKVLVPVLLQRPDLTQTQTQRLQFMIDYLQRKFQHKIEETRKLPAR